MACEKLAVIDTSSVHLRTGCRGQICIGERRCCWMCFSIFASELLEGRVVKDMIVVLFRRIYLMPELRDKPIFIEGPEEATEKYG